MLWFYTTNHRTKLTCRARKSLFLGYQLGFKGFVLLDLNTTKPSFLEMLFSMSTFSHTIPLLLMPHKTGNTSLLISLPHKTLILFHILMTPLVNPSLSFMRIMLTSLINMYLMRNILPQVLLLNLILPHPILLSEFLLEHDTDHPICKITFVPLFMMLLTNHP